MHTVTLHRPLALPIFSHSAPRMVQFAVCCGAVVVLLGNLQRAGYSRNTTESHTGQQCLAPHGKGCSGAQSYPAGWEAVIVRSNDPFKKTSDFLRSQVFKREVWQLKRRMKRHISSVPITVFTSYSMNCQAGISFPPASLSLGQTKPCSFDFLQP